MCNEGVFKKKTCYNRGNDVVAPIKGICVTHPYMIWKRSSLSSQSIIKHLSIPFYLNLRRNVNVVK
jgi:hypothetical protein